MWIAHRQVHDSEQVWQIAKISTLIPTTYKKFLHVKHLYFHLRCGRAGIFLQVLACNYGVDGVKQPMTDLGDNRVHGE